MSRHATVTLIRALAWKEWREQRALVVTGVALAILIPLLLMVGEAAAGRPLDMATLAGILPGIYILMLWPLLSVAAGAAAIANEIQDGTLGYLLSRPASRLRVWAVKVVMAFFSGLVILAGSLAIAWLFGLLAGTAAFSEATLGSTPLSGFLIIPATLLLFATSVFFSTFLTRAMTAAAAGLAASLLILAGFFLLWSRLEIYPRLEPEWMALEIFLAAGLLLLASLYLFWRGELLRGSGMRRLVPMASAMTVGLLGLVTVPLVLAHGRLTPSSAEIIQMDSSPSGDALVVTVTAKDRAIPRIWLVHSDGSGIEPVTGSLTFGPTMSPDGRWIAYFSRRGAFGLSREFPERELRAIRVDGSDDHHLATLASYTESDRTRASIAFSPDGTRVAAIGTDKLLIAPLSGGAGQTTNLAQTPLQQGSIAGWSADGTEVIVLSDGGRSAKDGSSMLAAVDAATGRIRPLYRSPEKTLIWLPHRRRAGWTRVPIVVNGSLLLVDVATGNTETLDGKTAYWSPRISDEGDELVYALSHRVARAPGESEIRLRNLADGTDRALATVSGMAGDIMRSPSGGSWIVNRYVDAKPIPSVSISHDGQTKELPPGWVGIGWYGREQVLLASVGDGSSLAALNATSGELRRLFP
ncbi:MAG TPA: ABC transporter permease subunit [Patescibacteria group bacterium]|nr:ABC transporter permease subunit [Patescibacteria group bacterium]